jgi:hypothetical protein
MALFFRQVAQKARIEDLQDKERMIQQDCITTMRGITIRVSEYF